MVCSYLLPDSLWEVLSNCGCVFVRALFVTEWTPLDGDHILAPSSTCYDVFFPMMMMIPSHFLVKCPCEVSFT